MRDRVLTYLIVDAMDEMTYQAISKYFTHLSNVGYFNQSNVNKLLLLTFIQELVDYDFRGLISEEDYNDINKALYCLYGSSCLIPYPDYYNTKRRRTMYIGSISELTHRVEALEEAVEQGGGGGGGGSITDKAIIVPSLIEEDEETTNTDSPDAPADPVVDGDNE